MRVFRDPAAGETAGTLPPTLSELFPTEGELPNDTGIASGDGTPKPADLAAAVDAAEVDDVQTPEPEKVPEAADPEPDEVADTPENFFQSVNDITGEPLDVDYGDVDPLTPQGIAVYTAAVRADEVIKFENHIRNSDPESYAYFLHRRSGGTYADFKSSGGSALPDQATFDADLNMQTAVYRQSLLNRGVDEDIADAQINKAIKDNTLGDRAQQAYADTKSRQTQQMVALEQQAAQERQQYEADCDLVLGNLSGAVDSGTVGFVIPENKKVGFKAFMRDSVRQEDGKFYAVQEIGKDVKNVVASMYFQFIKGDLSSMVERRAETKAVQRLKQTVQNAKSGSAKGFQATTKTDGYVSLGEI